MHRPESVLVCVCMAPSIKRGHNCVPYPHDVIFLSVFLAFHEVDSTHLSDFEWKYSVRPKSLGVKLVSKYSVVVLYVCQKNLYDKLFSSMETHNHHFFANGTNGQLVTSSDSLHHVWYE